jgi:hypothetical protein
MATIAKVVQYWMVHRWQKLLKFDELMQTGCGDAADSFC